MATISEVHCICMISLSCLFINVLDQFISFFADQLKIMKAGRSELKLVGTAGFKGLGKTLN